MRTQYCRDHIDKVAEECGLGPDTVSDVKKAAAFCDEHPDLSDCSTRAIMALIRIRDDPVREKAISSIEKSFESGKHPLTGQIIKKKVITEREVKKLIERAEIEYRKELYSSSGFFFGCFSNQKGIAIFPSDHLHFRSWNGASYEFLYIFTRYFMKFEKIF